jgi:anti-sigma factor RsiW
MSPQADDPGAREARALADLSAWLDGECDPERRARVEQSLRGEPALAARLSAWRRHDSALRAAFAEDPPRAAATGSGLVESGLDPLRAPPAFARDDEAPGDGARASARALFIALIAFLAGAAFSALAFVAFLLRSP